MSTSINEVRAAVLAAFKTVHTARYPTLKVDYPNLPIVDIEHQTDPFISLYLDVNNLSKAAMGETELLVPGIFHVTYYFLEGTGTAGAYSYTDMLNTYLCMRQVGSISFEEAKPTLIQTFPGWKGLMNTIRFNVCQVCA